MRHRKAGVKLGRTSSHRDAMFRNMVTSLFKHERIRTTDAKAKALRGWADHVITLAKRGDLHARRQALSIIREKKVVHKLFEEASERFGGINGGYTRVVKIGRRPGDAAPISLVELVKPEGVKPKKVVPKPTVAVTPASTPIESAPPAVESPEADAPAEEVSAQEETPVAEAVEETAETPVEAETAPMEPEEAAPSEESAGEEPEDADTRTDDIRKDQ